MNEDVMGGCLRDKEGGVLRMLRMYLGRQCVVSMISLDVDSISLSLSNSERDVDRAQKSDGEGGHVTRTGAGSAFQVATWYKLHSTQVSVDGYASSGVGTL